MTFGEKVKNERNRLGLNQDELAKKIGVTRRVISSYENDSSRPRGTERYKKLAEALGVNINYLLSEDEAFIADVEDNYGHRGAKQAKELLAEVTSLFAGGEMADEDMREMVDAIQEAYLIAKKNNKKYTPKKYRKDE
ncbi:XRE family transcriptional regulator [Eubacterium sp. OM08-24]|jgi:transcriptional regulator with XRE-family HTH domain|uniref:helix-turn-helix domain-containing protein n=1 Tax=Eubacterium sp. OM08-24 TaxID=2292352 RepID=UPI000E43CB05|nr:helix-turn-helix transcriptional regulator [Eubacterium sp. OM08-24]RGM17864.1 XRE family transcriptional regulator [Eubacterium sp. OM08-24]